MSMIPPTPTNLYTPMTEVKSLGVPGTRLVKMNSKRVLLAFVSMYRASVSPRSFCGASSGEPREYYDKKIF